MRKVPALAVDQWLRPEWDRTKFEPAPPRGKPEPRFYLFTLSAYQLKRLTGIYRRDPSKPPAEDTGIQRRHMPSRSREILRYMQHGFPLSRIDPKKLVDPSEIDSLRMPGWIPTAIVVNILTDSDQRGSHNSMVAERDLVTIEYTEGAPLATINLPEHLDGEDWLPAVHPIEVIDGQHRLWALEEPTEEPWTQEFRSKISELEIPVVAYHGLDTTWQAYLFYTINQLPKPINRSLVFDLYPLLRDEEWLLRFEGPNIYRETRAQDLTIVLWSHPKSPWHGRIIRLGGRERGKVTQASFIRSLMASFIKRWQGYSGRIGGLFGAPVRAHQTQLNWAREQQAAFLIMVWQELRDAIVRSEATWARALVERCLGNKSSSLLEGNEEIGCREALFSGPDTLLATDQGVRGYSNVINDLLGLAYQESALDLSAWDWTRPEQDDDDDEDDEHAVSDALSSLQTQLPDAIELVRNIVTPLATFDWRLPTALGPRDPQYPTQASYRGSGGYRELRRNMLFHLVDEGLPAVSSLANRDIEILRLEPEESE